MSALGILGGTFDPIHYGHLRLAQEAAESLALAEVRFIPCGAPPHRDAPAASPRQRLDMVRLALAGNPCFAADGRELERAGASYSVETLRELRAEVGERPLCFIVGADAFYGLTTWRCWRELLDLAHIAVAHRGGEFNEAALPQELRREFARRLGPGGALAAAPAGTIVPFAMTALDISASSIRQALRTGRSARYLLPDAVLDYIRRNRLYQEPDEA